MNDPGVSLPNERPEYIDERAWQALILRARDGLTYRAIGVQIGRCAERSRQLVNSAVRRLRDGPPPPPPTPEERAALAAWLGQRQRDDEQEFLDAINGDDL